MTASVYVYEFHSWVEPRTQRRYYKNCETLGSFSLSYKNLLNQCLQITVRQVLCPFNLSLSLSCFILSLLLSCSHCPLLFNNNKLIREKKEEKVIETAEESSSSSSRFPIKPTTHLNQSRDPLLLVIIFLHFQTLITSISFVNAYAKGGYGCKKLKIPFCFLGL